MSNFALVPCAFNKTHVVCKNAFKLPCEASATTTDPEKSKHVCFECAKSRTNYAGVLSCLNCHDEHKISSLESLDINSNQNYDFKETAKCIATKFDSSIRNVKERLSESPMDYYNFKTLLEYIGDEIDLRIESLKFQLENAQTRLNTKIDKFKSTHLDAISVQKASVEVTTLKSIKMFKQEELQILEDKYLHLLNSKINVTSGKASKKKLKITPVSSNMIGFLHGPVDPFDVKGLSSFKASVEILDMRNYLQSACGMCEIFEMTPGLTKYRLVVTDFAANDIKFLEKYASVDMNELKVESRVPIEDGFRRNKITQYYAMCESSTQADLQDNNRNEDHSIFICDMELHRVLIFDLKLTRLKRIVQGTRLKLEFECPRDICYADGHFYVLDQGSCSVDKFTHVGDFCASVCFNELEAVVMSPWSVRVTDQTMAILDWNQKILLYDLKSGSVKHVIEQPCVLSMCFISGHYPGIVQLFAHSENGDFKGYLIQDGPPELVYADKLSKLKYRSEFMIYTAQSQRFLISLGWSKAIAIVSLK